MDAQRNLLRTSAYCIMKQQTVRSNSITNWQVTLSFCVRLIIAVDLTVLPLQPIGRLP